MLVQRNKCGCAKRARVTGGDPGYRVSHMLVAWLTANLQGTIRTRSKHRVHLIQHMHSVHGHHLGVIPSKRAFSERVEFVVEVVEVDVLATVVEVVVLSVLDGSGTRFSVDVRVIVEELAASPGVVVHLVLSDGRQR